MTREEVSPDGWCRRHRELNKKLLPSSTDPNKEASNEDPPVAQNASRLVKAVFASQIDYIELRHMNGRVADSLFRLSPQEFFFKTKLPSPTGTNYKVVRWILFLCTNGQQNAIGTMWYYQEFVK